MRNKNDTQKVKIKVNLCRDVYIITHTHSEENISLSNLSLSHQIHQIVCKTYNGKISKMEMQNKRIKCCKMEKEKQIEPMLSNVVNHIRKPCCTVQDTRESEREGELGL